MKIILNITLPMSVLHAFSSMPQDRSLYLIVLLGFLCALFPLLLVYILSFRQEKEKRVFSMINIAGYNIGCFTLPIIQSFFGGAGAAIACLFDTGNAIMMTGGSYALTSTLLHTGGKKESIKDIVMKFLRSIPFDAYMILLGCTLLGIQIPEVLVSISEPIANANAFLAMLMLGMMLKIEQDAQSMKEVVCLLLQRFLLALLFSFLLFQYAPFSYKIRKILAITAFAPISTLAPVYTLACGGSSAKSSFANSISIFIGLLMMVLLNGIL